MSKYTQREVGGLYELTESARAELHDTNYYNEDLAPTKLAERTWGTYHIASLWIGMSVCIPTYMMASGLMGVGLSWWQALLNIAIANLLVLIPMQLNSHAGTKFGIPYPIFARLSFGIKGSHLASIARALVAAGWFGIQTWVGGQAINVVISSISDSWATWDGGKWVSFFVFWLITTAIAYKGPSAIKFMESWGAPVLGVLSLALMAWAVMAVKDAGFSIGDILKQQATYEPGKFWPLFLGGLGASIAFWSTLALNIPDFSRYAKNQKAQFRGQLLGLPTTMTAFAFVGVFVTGATVLIYGEAIWSPDQVLAKMDSPIAALFGAVGIVIATLTTNIAANVVAPANGISNINPKKITYRTGAMITAILGVAIMPWKLIAASGGYIFTWLGNYGIIIIPLAGIYVADYYIVKKRNIDVMDLFKGKEGRYWYKNGFNMRAIITWILAALLPVIGILTGAESGFWAAMRNNGVIIGFMVAIILYPILMKSDQSSFVTAEEEASFTER